MRKLGIVKTLLQIGLIISVTSMLVACAHRRSAVTAVSNTSKQALANNISKENATAAQKTSATNEFYADDEDHGHEQVTNIDPYESYNRKMFAFNRGVDKVIIRPVAKVYNFVLPSPVQKCVNNFFNNLAEVSHIINDLLQVNVRMAGHDTSRLLLNSTVGVFGLIDVASYIGVGRHEQDTGLTFAKWGDKNSPYLVLPILGPSTVRDFVGLAPNYFYLSVWPYIKPKKDRYLLLSANFLDARVQLLPTDKIINQAFDPYLAVKNAYLQHRNYLIDKNEKFNQDPFVDLNHRNGGGTNNKEAVGSRSITR